MPRKVKKPSFWTWVQNYKINNQCTKEEAIKAYHAQKENGVQTHSKNGSKAAVTATAVMDTPQKILDLTKNNRLIISEELATLNARREELETHDKEWEKIERALSHS